MDRIRALCAALLAAGSSSMACYGLSGMETPLFTVLILSFLICITQDRPMVTGLLLGLTVLTRPEGVVLGGTALLWLMLGHRTHCLPKILFGFLIVVGPWTIWRVGYYGFLLPNALVAKSGGDFLCQLKNGIRYFASYIVKIPFQVGLVAYGLVLLGIRLRGRRSFRLDAPELLVGLILFAHVVFVVLVGGDWMPGYRFMAPVAPLLSILTILLLGEIGYLAERVRTLVLVVIFLSLSSCLSSMILGNYVPRVQFWNAQVQALKIVGTWLNESLPPSTLIATFANGTLPYYASNLTVIDMLGLTDRHIAHNGLRIGCGPPGHIAYDYAYVAARRPVIVAFLKGQGFETVPSTGIPLSAMALAGPALEKSYEVVTFEFPEFVSSLGKYVNLLIQKEQAQEIIHRLTPGKGPYVIKPGSVPREHLEDFTPR